MKGSILFILGAGASVDSGMKVYRNPSATDKYYTFDESDPNKNPLDVSCLKSDTRMEQMWEHLTPLYRDCDTCTPGPTYIHIQRLIDASTAPCLILTQNVDGLAKSIVGDSVTLIELHGTHSTVTCLSCYELFQRREGVFRCEKCGGWLRPNIVLFGEDLHPSIRTRVFTWIHKHHPTLCYVVGTSMRWPYLRSFIDKAKSKNAHVIHINPDPEYYWHRKKEKWYMNTATQEMRYKLVNRKNPEELRRGFFYFL